MDSKLNYLAIEAYSIAYAKKLANSFFSVEETINGKQILSLSNIPQVNLLVIKNLFQKWKKETGKLQSPYFNYEAEEVKAALQHFMNVLSNNITIRKSNFEPLLKKAVTDALLLIFSPYDFYSKEINHPERTRISLDDLKEINKYIKVNKTLLHHLMSRFEKDDIDEVFNDEGFSILNEIYEEIELPKIPYSEFLDKFSEVYPITLDVIFEEVQEESTDEDFKKPLQKEAPEPINLRENENHEVVKNINERFQKPQKTLHEQLSPSRAATLADLHQKSKINSLKQYITLNQKFMFVKELFSGNQEEYNRALEKLEQSHSYDEAMHFLNKDCISKYDWDMEGEETQEFMEILNKKFN